jgi:hypothetical protein
MLARNKHSSLFYQFDMDKKSFLTLKPGFNIIKTFTLSDTEVKKLGCLLLATFF